MRNFVWFATLAFAGAALAQSAKVTYTTVATSPKKALAELSAKSGMKLESTPAMDREVLILRLKDASIDDVMKQIASVTSGAWEKQGEIYYLVADQAARQREASAVQQAYAARIAARLKKLQDQLTKPVKPDKNSQQDPSEMIPAALGNSSLNRLALAIGAGPLAQIPEAGRVVYSTQPTRMQLQLPSSTGPLISQFVVEYNKRAAEAKQSDESQIPPEAAAILELIRPKKPQVIKGPPAKALVVIERRTGLFSGMSLKLKLYDADGKILADETSPLSFDLPFNPTDFGKPAPAPTNNGPEIKLSDLSKELYDLGRSFSVMGGASNIKLSKELLAAMSNPVERDPLSFVESEALIATAEQRNEQLVANLPDNLLSFWENLKAKGKLTAQAYISSIKGEGKTKVSEADGWLVVSPDNPVQSRSERVDRFALYTLIRSAQTQGYATLDDLAAYSLKNQSPIDGAPASGMYLITFAPNALQEGMMGMVDWDMLRFYGTLNPTQRQSLREGGRLPFGQMSPGQQQLLTNMLFGADVHLQVQGTQRQNSDPLMEMIVTQMSRFGGGQENDFRTEPTEVMPTGLPAVGFVSVAFSSEPIAQAQTMSSDLGRMSSLSSFELGLLKFLKEDPKMSQVAGQIPTIDDLRVGSRSVWNFSLNVAPQVSQKATLNDDRIPKDATVYKMGNLPADFQKRIDDMVAQFKKNPFWSLVGQMGGMRQGVPPSN